MIMYLLSTHGMWQSRLITVWLRTFKVIPTADPTLEKTYNNRVIWIWYQTEVRKSRHIFRYHLRKTGMQGSIDRWMQIGDRWMQIGDIVFVYCTIEASNGTDTVWNITKYYVYMASFTTWGYQSILGYNYNKIRIWSSKLVQWCDFCVFCCRWRQCPWNQSNIGEVTCLLFQLSCSITSI